MIPSGVQIYVALEPIDMRLSFDRLSGFAKEQIGYEARSGALFVFFGRRRDALKVLFFDGIDVEERARTRPPRTH
jgi:transposase